MERAKDLANRVAALTPVQGMGTRADAQEHNSAIPPSPSWRSTR